MHLGLLIAALLISVFSLPVTEALAQPKEMITAIITPVEPVEVIGVVTNVAFGVSEHVRMSVTQTDAKTYRAVGNYDCKTLFGRFDVPGTVIHSEGNDRCVQFTGDIEIGGNDNSGVSEVLKLPYVMTLYFSQAGAKGVYHIGPAPSLGADFPQYGTMDLAVHGRLGQLDKPTE